MVKRWQNDAKGILIFVSPRINIHAAKFIIWSTIDRSIFCCCLCTPWRDDSGPEAKQSGYICILSWKDL